MLGLKVKQRIVYVSVAGCYVRTTKHSIFIFIAFRRQTMLAEKNGIRVVFSSLSKVKGMCSQMHKKWDGDKGCCVKHL